MFAVCTTPVRVRCGEGRGDRERTLELGIPGDSPEARPL